MSRTTMFGRFELLGRVSTGGMAEVFRARDTQRGAVVAVKRILPEIAEDDEFVRMFEDEARIASQLEHPYIARMLDYGRVERSYYISFEFVDGKDLRILFDRFVRTKQKPPLAFVLYVFTRIAEGLSYAHARRDAEGRPVSIVHRDVSPQNIIVSYSGDAKLIDFGIAKAANKVTRTQIGTLKGKFGYMAPEQVRGEEVDQRVDVFSLGICMWEFLTLERLFSAENEIRVLEKVRTAPILPPSLRNPDVPVELDRVVLKALAKDKNERYRSARELYKDLNHLAHQLELVATRDEIAQYMRRAFPEGAPPSPQGARAIAPPPASRPVFAGGGNGNAGHAGDGVDGGGRGPDRYGDRGFSGGRDARQVQRQVQETRTMAAENKGSDLDIFEGLGKKAPSRAPSAPALPRAPGDNPAKKTLLGIPGPASSPSVPAAPPPPPGSMPSSRPPSMPPPPPPGRGSLPSISAPASKSGGPPPPPPTNRPPSMPPPPPPVASAAPPPPPAPVVAPPPVAAPPASIAPPPAAAAPAAPPASTNGAKANGGLEMDWDDEDEATHIFDKGPTDELLDRAGPRPAAGVPAAAAGGVPKTTLLGVSAPGSLPPPTPPTRPTPGPSGFAPVNGADARAASAPSYAPPAMPQRASLPPPSGALNDLPPSMPGSAPPRSMENTALVVPNAQNRTGLFVGVGAVAAAVVAGAFFFVLMPRTGKITVNAVDPKGGVPNHVEVFVDGTKRCDTVPCIVDQVSAGEHPVKIVATGYETPAPKAVVVESRRETPVEFTLVSNVAKAGTGFKVAGSQPGVKLYIDGREIGPLPQELRDLEPGDHKIRIAGSDRYAAVERNVTVMKDELQDLGTQTLKVVKGKATIALDTPNAKVYLVSGTDRRELPTLPISVDIDTSKAWSLEAVKPGYQEFKQAISFEDGQAEKTFNVVLEPKGGAAAAGAAPAAATPVAVRAPAPPPAPAREPKPVTAAAAAPAAASDAQAGEAWLNINSIPAASVVLNGKPIGNTPKVKVSVKPGTHTVLFVNSDEGLKKSITVTVGAGETKAAVAKLRD